MLEYPHRCGQPVDILYGDERMSAVDTAVTRLNQLQQELEQAQSIEEIIDIKKKE